MTGPDAAGTSVTRIPTFFTPASRAIPAGPASALPMPFVSTNVFVPDSTPWSSDPYWTNGMPDALIAV